MDDDVSRIRALANASRLTVMRWLKEPHLHFPTQQHADMQKVGVCCSFISDKLGVAPATTTRHMQILANAGLVRATRLGKYTYYKRIDRELKRLVRDVANF